MIKKKNQAKNYDIKDNSGHLNLSKLKANQEQNKLANPPKS